MQQLFDQPLAECRITSDLEGDSAANTIRSDIQVIDRVKNNWKGRWAVLVFIATEANGAPGGTQTVTLNTGTILDTITPNETYLVLTEADGTFQIDVNTTLTQTLYLHTAVLGKLKAGQPMLFT